MQNLFPASRNPYNMRVQPEFESFNICTVYNGIETISYRGPKIWALVPNHIKESVSLNVFKSKIKNWMHLGCTCRIYARPTFRVAVLFNFHIIPLRNK